MSCTRPTSSFTSIDTFRRLEEPASFLHGRCMTAIGYRNALVTGGDRRIGAAIVRSLADAGLAIAIHSRQNGDEAKSLASEIESAGGRARLISGDLSSEIDIENLIRAGAEALEGPIDCLINNASVFERDEIGSVSRESWDKHLDVNLWAPVKLIQNMSELLPVGRPGAVVNILDERVWNLTPDFLSYTVSKAGLWTLTRTLALALAPYIRVNAIGPGPTLPSPRQSVEQFEAQAAATPLGHGADPKEIGAAVRYILEAPSMTGQMIALDGGQHLGWTMPGETGDTVE